MEQRMGIGSTLWRSAFDAATYRRAATGSTGRAFGYLATLVALAALIVTVQAHLGLNRAARQFAATQWWAKNLPEIRIENGQASSPVPQPFVFEQGRFTFILDTTGATTALDPKYRQGALLMKTEVIVRRQRGYEEERRIALSQVPDMIINQTTIEALLNRLAAWGWVAVLLVMTIWLWIAKLLQVLLWSLLGLIVNAAARRHLRFGALFRIGVVALTVQLYFDLIKDSVGWVGVIPVVVSLAIYGAYLAWGILVQPTSDIRPQTSDSS